MQTRELFLIAIQVLFFAVLITAAATDIRSRKIYNLVTFPGIAFGLTLGFCAGDSSGLESHVKGLLIGGGVFGLAWLAGSVNGGDWKLMAAVGAIKGYPFIIAAMWYSSLVGCAIALGFLFYHGRLLSGMSRSFKQAVGIRLAPLAPGDPIGQRIPYGAAVAFGSMLAWALVELDGRTGATLQ